MILTVWLLIETHTQPPAFSPALSTPTPPLHRTRLRSQIRHPNQILFRDTQIFTPTPLKVDTRRAEGTGGSVRPADLATAAHYSSHWGHPLPHNRGNAFWRLFCCNQKYTAGRAAHLSLPASGRVGTSSSADTPTPRSNPTPFEAGLRMNPSAYFNRNEPRARRSGRVTWISTLLAASTMGYTLAQSLSKSVPVSAACIELNQTVMTQIANGKLAEGPASGGWGHSPHADRTAVEVRHC